MYKGKITCEALKAVRKKIADANGIDYQPSVCKHQGDCSGTCQKCESEARYIEKRLSLMQSAGKAVKIIGLATGVSALCAELPSCDDPFISGDEPERTTEFVFVNDTDHDIEINTDTDTIKIKKGLYYHCQDDYLNRNLLFINDIQVVYDDTVAIRFHRNKSAQVEGKEFNFLRNTSNCENELCVNSYVFTDADYQYAFNHKDDVEETDEETEKQHIIRPIPKDSTTENK
ncbi:MAG: hypothetical protein IKP37_10005 [Paludibacteraceae bacterium]|nr:hypothetical protein [Paludibacteraceae bacterium]